MLLASGVEYSPPSNNGESQDAVLTYIPICTGTLVFRIYTVDTNQTG